MSKKKAFLLGFSLTLAVLVPVYLAVCAYGLSRTAPVEQKQQGVPVVQPLSTDARTLALMTGEGGPQTFVLVRFDAYEGRITTAALDAQTVVLCGGQGMTLFEVAQQMGPAGVPAALEETLGAPVDNYIYCTARRLASLTENFGSAQLKLTNYMTSEALGELQLSVPGVSELTLSTQVLCETLEAQVLSRDAQTLLRAQGYLAFARAASGQLEQKAANAMRAAVAKDSTDLTAVQLYDYQRIFKFLDKIVPEARALTFPGRWNGDRYELSSDFFDEAAAFLGAREAGESGSEAGSTPQGQAPAAAQGENSPKG